MPTTLKFSRWLDLSQLPGGWEISRVAVDWKGKPLLLVEEGKPPYPGRNASIEAQVAWMNTPPKGCHLVYWEGASRRALTFDNSSRLFSAFVQQFDDGWLLSGARSGGADVCDKRGQTKRTLDLGDAIRDVQTTASGRIWVSYFDEGVFGTGIGQNGLVCFNSLGRPIFKYAEFAEQHQLPFIHDCYAMNVAGEEEIWISYYSDFPLVAMRNFQLDRIWKEFGCISDAFAIHDGAVIFPKCYTRSEGKSQLLRRSLSSATEAEIVNAVDERGMAIDGLFTAAVRGADFYLLTDSALYKLQMES